MVGGPKILHSTVMHRRLRPRVNHFSYRVYHLFAALDELDKLSDGRFFGVDRAGFYSFWRRDHGLCDGSSLEAWATQTVQERHPSFTPSRVRLIAMPRLMGYGFNPVSFWLCEDAEGLLRVVICEVRNTFGEQHLYLCSHPDLRPITAKDTLTAQKDFHVSPFFKREGSYRFKFDVGEEHFRAWINYFGADGKAELVTRMQGVTQPATRSGWLKALIRCPLVTLKTISLIHWQALKIVTSRIPYVPKPAQLKHRVTHASDPVAKVNHS